MCHPPHEARAVAPVSGGVGSDERRFEIETSGTMLPIFEAAPQGGSGSIVVIIHDIYGARDFYDNLARRFAQVGYTAWLPDLFVRQGPLAAQNFEAAQERGSRFSYPQAVLDLGRVVDEATAGGAKVGTVGFCMGGTLVSLLAARDGRVAGGVIYYGFPANANPSANRPWEPIQEAAEVQHPLLGFWGDQDHGVGMDNVERYRAALGAARKTFDFTIYPGAPHGFLAFDGSKPYLAESEDSWARMLSFFGDRLGS